MRRVFQIRGGIGGMLIDVIDEVSSASGGQPMSFLVTTVYVAIEKWVEFCRIFDESGTAEVVLA